MTTNAPQKPLNPETRLARIMLPDLDPHSALLPTNKWIIDTLKAMVKTNAGIRGKLIRAGSFALGGIAAIGAGIAGAIMAPTLLVAGAIGAAAVATAGIAGFFAKKQLVKIKTDHMNDVQEIIKNRYLEMKAQELKRAWQERAEKVRLEREAKRAADAARKAQEAAAAVEVKAATPAADAQKPEDKPQAPASKTAMMKIFGRWAVSKAKDGAHAIEDKIHDAIENKPGKPTNSDVPAAPARKNTNSAPKNGG